MNAMPPRFAITPEEIDAQVRAFYAEIRVHPVLGPIFNARRREIEIVEEALIEFLSIGRVHPAARAARAVSQDVQVAVPHPAQVQPSELSLHKASHAQGRVGGGIRGKERAGDVGAGRGATERQGGARL